MITKPMPSMPVALWGDPDGERYRSSYFDRYPGVWRQGDWIRFTERGSCVLTGRSDATLNRGGVRLGPASSTPWSRSCRRSPTRWSSTSRTRRAAWASCCCSWSPAPGTVVDDAAAGADRRRAAPRAVAAPRPRRDRRGPGDPAHADRQEARGPGQAHPARRAAREGGQPRTRWPTRRRWTRSSPWPASARWSGLD